ncbi:MAG: DPP IV N-terminal domain-containing protein, partial [Limnohabitans sp.]|nr:DPP IV N-terminal domain-containing protein [Limnohabitans sp.]
MMSSYLSRCVSIGIVALASATMSRAQTYTPMREIPGGNLVQRMQSALSGIGDGGRVEDIRWNLVAGELWFQHEGWKTVDLATGKINAVNTEPPASATVARSGRDGRERRPARGRQFTREESPDGAWTAVSENGNLFLEPKSGNRVQVTTDGTSDLKYGQASWVYGEELDQTTAMWWSPDAASVAFYRFDESQVKDFFILDGWTDVNTRVLSEAYPKPGAANPTASLLVHHIASRKTVEIDALSEVSGAQPNTE